MRGKFVPNHDDDHETLKMEGATKTVANIRRRTYSSRHYDLYTHDFIRSIAPTTVWLCFWLIREDYFFVSSLTFPARLYQHGPPTTVEWLIWSVCQPRVIVWLLRLMDFPTQIRDSSNPFFTTASSRIGTSVKHLREFDAPPVRKILCASRILVICHYKEGYPGFAILSPGLKNKHVEVVQCYSWHCIKSLPHTPELCCNTEFHLFGHRCAILRVVDIFFEEHKQ